MVGENLNNWSRDFQCSFGISVVIKDKITQNWFSQMEIWLQLYGLDCRFLRSWPAMPSLFNMAQCKFIISYRLEATLAWAIWARALSGLAVIAAAATLSASS